MRVIDLLLEFMYGIYQDIEAFYDLVKSIRFRRRK